MLGRVPASKSHQTDIHMTHNAFDARRRDFLGASALAISAITFGVRR